MCNQICHQISCVQKLDAVFGNVLPVERLLERFWSARQSPGESVSAWSCRLQHMVSLIRSKDPALFPPGNNLMLSNKFWSGLREDRMRLELRYLMDSGASCNKMLENARIAEMDGNKRVSSHQTTAAENIRPL